MPSEWKIEEAVFALRTLADVVDDPRARGAIRRGDNEGNVWQFSSDGAGDEITGTIVSRVLRNG